MKIYIKMASIFLILAMLLITPAYAASTQAVLAVTGTTVAPVESVTATTPSAPLMPGDTGTVVVTVTNTLKAAGQGNTSTHTSSMTNNYFGGAEAQPGKTETTSDQTTSSDAATGVASVRFLNLISTGPVHVINGSQTNIGQLGPGDSAKFEFTITVDDNAANGKYFLPLSVKTDSDTVFINQVVAVVVDNTTPKMVINDVPTKLTTSASNIVLDVVNYRANDVNSVSVVPSGDEFSFKPRGEYTVGSIGAGEMYTVTFATSSKNISYSTSPSFMLKYKNGDNWHQSAPMVVQINSQSQDAAAQGGADSNTLLIVIGVILVVLIAIGGIYAFMRSQRAKK
ncbi:MAG TPA: hypothetical protein VK436_05285 [Methanocella sp.]|nr:hypothetical protein [Methanocella sp.]